MKRPRRNQFVGIVITCIIIFIFFAPVIVATQLREGHYAVTPTCVSQPCQLAQPGNSSSGYVDWRSLTNVTVYESIGFKYTCIGVQMSVPWGAGSVGCGGTHFAQSAQVVVHLESCSTAGTSPKVNFASNIGEPTCFLKLSNVGNAGTGAASCTLGGLTGVLLTANAAASSAPIQISPSSVTYVECQASAGASTSTGIESTGAVQLTNGAIAVYAGTWTA